MDAGDPIRSTAGPELAAELAWTRRLALHLAHGDAARADELVGDAWLVALQQPEPVGGGFLRRALERLAGGSRRSDARRRHHEAAAARSDREEGADPAALVQRAERSRDLVEQVLALDEPSRDVLLLRYLQELPPSEIARRTGVPLATVKTRLARGLVRLRERMDADAGGAERWLGALLPAAALPPRTTGGAPVAAPPWLLLGGMMTTKAVVGGAVALSLGAALWLWSPWSESEAVRSPAVAAVEDDESEAALESEPVPLVEPRAVEGPGVERSPATPAESRAEAEVPLASDPFVPPPATAPVSGVLVVPAAWNWQPDDSGTLRLRSESGAGRAAIGTAEMEPNRAADVRLRWSTEEALVGAARATFDPLGAQWTFDVPQEGRDDVELVVPPPAEVAIRVLDVYEDRYLDAEELANIHLGAYPVMAGEMQQPFRTMGFVDSDGAFRFRIAEGRIVVFITALAETHRRGSVGQRFDVVAGQDNLLDYEIRPTGHLVVVFRDPSGQLVSDQPHAIVEGLFTPLDGQPIPAKPNGSNPFLLSHGKLARSDQSGGNYYVVSTTGRFDFRFVERPRPGLGLPKYDVLSDRTFEVDLPVDGEATLEITLTR